MLKSSPRTSRLVAPLAVGLLFCSIAALHGQNSPSGAVLTGKAAFTDHTKEAPGVRRKLTVADLPAPYATKSVDSGGNMVKGPDKAWPQDPAGIQGDLVATC